jgi:hypothetical protein
MLGALAGSAARGLPGGGGAGCAARRRRAGRAEPSHVPPQAGALGGEAGQVAGAEQVEVALIDERAAGILPGISGEASSWKSSWHSTVAVLAHPDGQLDPRGDRSAAMTGSRHAQAGAGGYSRRTSAPASGAAARQGTSAPWPRSRAIATAPSTPYAHLQQADITLEQVQASPCCGTRSATTRRAPSDGACAVVPGDVEEAAAAGDCGLDPRHRDVQRADDVRGQGPRQPGRGPGVCRGAVAAGWHYRPADRDRRGRDLRAVLLVRADVAGEPRLRRAW